MGKSFASKVLTFVLTALGFVACDIEDLYGTPVLYGVLPQNQVRTLGRVTDKSGRPIEGIRVVKSTQPYAQSSADTAYSDATGKYEFDVDEKLPERVEFCDTDGDENGSYQNEVHNLDSADITTDDGELYTVRIDVKMKEK